MISRQSKLDCLLIDLIPPIPTLVSVVHTVPILMPQSSGEDVLCQYCNQPFTRDVLLILLGYVLMHTTFYLLISRSRALGSNFWLPCAIMSSSILALLLSLPIAMALCVPHRSSCSNRGSPFLGVYCGFRQAPPSRKGCVPSPPLDNSE
jgi:hypothetical protein